MEYSEPLKLAVEHHHNWFADHASTVPVLEVFRGQTVWQRDVEVFGLTGHAKAKRSYGWSTGEGQEEKFTGVLEVPSVKDALTAVQVSIVAEAKKGRKP